MPRLLIIDTDACGLALAWRAALAGHQVRWWAPKGPFTNQANGDGFHKSIQKIDNWVASMGWADLVFTTSNASQLERLDAFKKRGFTNIFAPSKKSADLEVKRGLGMKFMEDHKIAVPEYLTFKSLKEAEKHVWQTQEAYVFKTLGDNDDKSLSYVGKHAADLISKLQHWQKEGMNPQGNVMLQKKVTGVEFCVSKAMGSNGWVGLANEGFEHKKFMSSNYGPNTGEMGSIGKYVSDSKLADEVLAPIESALLDIGHRGFCDVNCIIDDEGKVWPLEYTMRPGWPIFNLILAATKGDPIEWMIDSLYDKDTHQVNTDTGAVVVLAQPPFPCADTPDFKALTGIPIYGVTKKNSEYIQPMSVCIKDLPDMENNKVVIKPTWATAGDYVAYVTGFGSTTAKATKRAYGTISDLSFANMQVRDDIGECVPENLLKLKSHGFATDWKE